MRRRNVLLLGSCLLLGGCLGRTPAPTLYMLTAIDPTAGRPLEVTVSVGVGPVTVSEYLRRPEIVRRTRCGQPGDDSCGQLRPSELDRWAEPLGDAVTRVLSENLSTLLASERVVRYPWRPTTPIDYQVTVDVLRFDADAKGEAVLTASWSVLGEGGEVLFLERSRFVETVDSHGHGPVVASLSRALARLSRQISGSLAGLVAE